ncbi:MAG: GNAT family N-acetyltransferase [Deltaproteobacteria bacterium]|nr:GNAT family N-acetyltransferase [Deltaproteobacteria bacterium]
MGAEPGQGAIEIRRIAAGGELHRQELQLRGEVLRRPLGMAPETAITPFDGEALRFVALDGGLVVGCVLLHLRGEEGKLFQMAVLPAHQGRGIGRALVAALEDEARARGLRRIFCHARHHARGYYARLGYQVTGDPFLEIGLEHHRMVKELGP